MMDPVAAHPATAAARPLAPGAALLRAAPRLRWQRAALLIAAFFALWLALQILFGLPLLFLVSALVPATPQLFSHGDGANVSLTTLTGCILALGMALGAVVAVTLLRRWGAPTLAALGLRRESTWAREIALGAALGPLAFGLVLALELACGWATVDRGSIGPGGLLLGVLSCTGVAVNEEIVFRGFVLQVLGRAWNPRGALIASSLLFAAMHSLNPNATPVAIACLVVAGLALAWGFFATGRLWLPIALHWSWNLAQGPLFGFPVSGVPDAAILAVTSSGPAWATGGAFGPEASVLGLLAEVLLILVILGWRRAGASGAATTATALGGLAGLAFLVVMTR
ncbi:MAG TPA: type II CAAX endopeptidase family protein [Chloroflexota bacterium]|nr:type II CAAX endopeptidase family protein [Chloroflexota bacterium]